MVLNKNDNLFIVDLESVSFLDDERIVTIASDDKEYHKMPFLYLVSSYLRNQAIMWASEKYRYIEKKQTGSWMVYKFIN